jgi:hypothetical protein
MKGDQCPGLSGTLKYLGPILVFFSFTELVRLWSTNWSVAGLGGWGMTEGGGMRC